MLEPRTREQAVDDLRRQRLNLRAISESLDSALRHHSPDENRRTLDRANLLLEAARRDATSSQVKDEIEVLQDDLDRRSGIGRSEESPQ